MAGYRDQIPETTGDPTGRLTDKQRGFVHNVLRGMTQTMAARAAGYTHPREAGSKLIREPHVQESIRFLQGKYEKAAQMTRKKVMDGMLEAIEMAKIQGDPGVMVSGWREIGRMCGYYAAEKREINVNITAKRAVDKLETLSDDELLEMIEKDSEAIEGEFTEVFQTAEEAQP